jgi:hypothetical protein
MENRRLLIHYQFSIFNSANITVVRPGSGMKNKSRFLPGLIEDGKSKIEDC